ncbi:hypothetical protein A4A49_47675 [Nicotiana attenuata]|uniref:Uncharacterized protein n=1 Tax=Nicotiana attenuata TaxID=49451 RepID=A0A1J6JU33_NICAT|nr:hypothetical protein A4A49_47675 [Nicotiana attenuata]
MEELQALKLFVENKFEEVLAAIGKQSMKSMKPEGNSAHKQQYNDPDFREMHNDYDQFQSGHVGNDPVVIGDSMPKAPSISGFAGVGQDGCATGVNVKNVTTSDGVVNEDLPSVPFVNEHDFGFDSNFDLSASAIDQITAITQQATYKQSSHDVKKSGPAPLPSGILVQTRADVVIESNTAPQACRVDGVGQVDVGGSNVNLPSGNELTIGAVKKSKLDQSVSRSIVQIQTDVETTPAVLTRKRRPAAVKQSPYRNDWQSGVSAVGGSSKVIKGRFSFVNDISETVNFKLTTAFSNFVEANMQLGECVFVSMEVYLPVDQKLEPCFDFGVEQIDDKIFFHTLNYSGRPLSSSVGTDLFEPEVLWGNSAQTALTREVNSVATTVDEAFATPNVSNDRSMGNLDFLNNDYPGDAALSAGSGGMQVPYLLNVKDSSAYRTVGSDSGFRTGIKLRTLLKQNQPDDKQFGSGIKELL